MKPLRALALAVFAFTFAGTAAQARPEYLNTLLQTYKPYAAKLQARSCANCHVSDSDFTRNPYGKAIALEMDQEGIQRLTPDILHKVENKDLFGNGKTVLDAIKAGVAPGEPASGGKGKAKGKSGKSLLQEVKPSWFPSYAYHPAIVHFPIALFISGLALDFFGMIRKNQFLLYAGWYNLILAALSAVVALITGYMALVLLNVPFAGVIREHIIAAIASSVIIWTLVALRVHKQENMTLTRRSIYYVLAAAGLLVVSLTGHLGGLFVYGS